MSTVGPGGADLVRALALTTLAAALLVAPGAGTARRRIRPARVDTGRGRRVVAPALTVVAAAALGGAVGSVPGLLLGLAGACAALAVAPRWSALRDRWAPPRADPLAEAGAWDQLAACLRAGLPVDRAARAVVPVLPAAAGDALARVADLMSLGADTASAWAPALDEPSTARLARAARRSARSGAAVADVVEAVAADVRAQAADAVEARAERAGVLVTGPLGLCFLPAFLALGIVPVIVGLAGPLLEQR